MVDVAPEILARYVGTYQGYWLSNEITVEVTLEGDALYMRRTPAYQGSAERSQLVPQSENSFDSSYGLSFIFSGEDDEGMATEVSEIHVSGAWDFTRVP